MVTIVQTSMSVLVTRVRTEVHVWTVRTSSGVIVQATGLAASVREVCNKFLQYLWLIPKVSV